MYTRLYTYALFFFGVLSFIPATAQQDAACAPVDAQITQGEVFFNYGSATDAYSVNRRSSYSLGQPVAGIATSPTRSTTLGFWARFLVPPLAPIVIATQGELLDRIQLSWDINPLGALASEGYKIYRDDVFLALVDDKTRNYNDFNVIAGRAYKYEVRAVNNFGEGFPGIAIGFQVPNGVVTGWIQTPSGRPVPDALVTLTPLQGFSAKFGITDGAFALADTSTAESFLPAANGEWTLAFWVKTTSATANAGIVSLHPFPLIVRPIASAGGHEGIVVAQTDASAALLTAQFPDGTKNDWHHVALTIDADGKGRLYVDGALVEIADLPPVPSAEELRLGARTEAAGTWQGRLDEVRVYHRRLDELDLGEVKMGTASSLTAGLQFYWKMDEELGTGSFDVVRRNKLYFCGAAFNSDRPYVRTMGKTNEQGFYRIESASYGTGTTFLADPMKDFYMYRTLKFVRDSQDYATLPDFSVTPKATLELWVNSAGPDGDQCLISKTWPSNDFRLLIKQSGLNNNIWFYVNGQEHNFGSLGVGYQHLAFTLDTTTTDNELLVTAYKNGVLLGNHIFSGVTGNWSDPTGNWLLGARTSGMSRTDYYGGLIDEVALYDTTLNTASILNHFQNGREMSEKGLRVYFSLDEGNGNRLNNSGSVLLPYGTNNGAEWSPFAARQKSSPHEFTPVTRQVTLNPSVTSVDQVDFTDRSTVPVSGYVRYKNTDCFAQNVEILVNGASFSPRIFTDSTGKFIIDFDPGTTAELTPVFEDHFFVPAFWEVTNVVSPIAGILFNDITTRKVKGVVAGGECKKSVIEAPPGTGTGTVCVVKVRSVDGCLERQIILDNQEGEYEFDELPPLESLTVAVVEHSDPDVKSFYQVLGGATVNLTKTDTIIDFIYFAPPEVTINSGLDTIPGCSPPLIVLDQGENVTLTVSLVERYVPIVDNMNVVLDEGLCPLDTANFRFINGFSDEVFDTTMSGTTLKYKFQVGEPNPSPPFIKTLQILGTSLAGRTGSLVKQAVVTGIRKKENTFTTMMPEIPTIILRDPPGDGSSSFLEKNEKICKTTTIKGEFEVGVGATLDVKVGPKITLVLAPLGIGVIEEIEPKVLVSTEAQVTYKRVSDSTFQTCTSFSNKISTSDGELIVGGARGGDVFVGEAINLIFGFADEVTFDTCTPTVKQIISVDPGTFATTYMYSEFQIQNYMKNYLAKVAADPGTDSATVVRCLESIVRWDSILLRNNILKDSAKFVRNISFDSGVQYEYSETSDTSGGNTVENYVNSEFSIGTGFGFEIKKVGFEGKVKLITKTSNTVDAGGDSNERGVTIGYSLKDNDPGDMFTVDVSKDSVYKTPVFKIKAGQSSCPWEPGTANREAPNLQLALGSQFKAVNVPSTEPAVFNFNLGNLSATNEDWTYGFTAVASNNPDGALIRLNGEYLNNKTVKYIVPYNTSTPVTLTVERGPVAYEYDSLLVALVSECEMDRNFALSLPLAGDPKFFSGIYLGVDFIRPCSEVAVTTPEQNWVVLNDDPIQPGTIRRITVSGYDLNSTDFQLVRVQYRRTDGDGAWINITGPGGLPHERYNPNWSGFSTLTPTEQANTLGPSFTQYFWETDGLGDGPYEVHAWAVCTGDASDKPGFSDIIKGRIDREPPKIVGLPQPSDGVYQVGDEISFTFNQHINCDKLVPPVGKVELYNTVTNTLLDINMTCFENKIVIDPSPSVANKFLENLILRAELSDIEDLVGNSFNGTKFNSGVWEFFVDRNELAWLTDSLGITKFDDEAKTGTANIHNRGGYPVPFTIHGAPDWVHVVPNQGTLAPNEIRAISFTIDPDLSFGNWSDTIVLRTETGQNPFFMGGDEPLPLGARVVCRPPYSTFNPDLYENSMSMVLKLNIEGAFSTDVEDIAAAYMDDELRGYANVRYIPQLGTYLVYLNVYGNPSDMLKPVRIEIWDASACQRYGSVVEAFTFQPDNVIGITDNPQVVHTSGLLMREIPFKYGWNWLSFNLAFPDNSLNAALASLKHPDGNLIRGQAAFSEYNSGWFGSLANLSNTTMYIHRTDMPDTLRMQGTPIDPLTTNIPVVAGWNWVGYIPNYSLPINDALASLPAQYGDVAKSQYAFAQYLNPTFGWIGSLKYMSPPNGYQIKLAQAGTLTYPPPSTPFGSNGAEARGDNDAPVPTHWTVNPTQFEHSNTLIGMIRSNGLNATTSDMELGVFVGNEVRGTAQAIYIEPLDAHLFFLTMYANTPGELLRFKLYNDADGSVRDLTETMYFSPNQHQGSIENPVPFEWLVTSTEEDFGTTVGFDVQPNPFASETTLRFNLPKAEDVLLTISDAQGREVVRKPISAAAGPNVATWNGRSDTGSWLSSGVYTVRLQTETGNVSKKVVLQRLP